MTVIASASGGSPGVRTSRRHPGEAGFTLVELVVTIAVIGILAALAIPSFRNIMPKIRLGTATQTLANEIALLRTTAIAKNMEYEVTIDWVAKSYTLSRTNATTLLGGGIAFEFTRFKVGEPYTTPADTFVKLYPNGSTSVPMSHQALWITLRTTDGLSKKRVVVASTGRIHSEKWLGGTESDPANWKAD